MDRIITDQEKEKIINFGALYYDNENMAIILEWPLKEVENLMKNESSEFKQLYKRGSAVADYLLNVKIFEMAKSGDLKAFEAYSARLRRKGVQL